MECEGKAFCYLPILTDAKLGLPLHINGSFYLSENRQSLWMSENDSKTLWNRQLLTKVVSALWAHSMRDATGKNSHENSDSSVSRK